jgi:hypothetical protein
MWFTLDGTPTSGRSRTLDRRADRLSELLGQIQKDLPENRARKFQAFADATGGGLIEVFKTDGSRALPSPSSAALAFPWPAAVPLKAERFSEIASSGQPYRVLARPYSSGSGSLRGRASRGQSAGLAHLRRRFALDLSRTAGSLGAWRICA